MASRFWVGGTGNWDAATTTHWSATSGGAGGASVPGVNDDVYFDAASGGGTVTVTATQSVFSVTGGSFTGTFDLNGQTLTCNTGSFGFDFSGTGVRTLILGSGTINTGVFSLYTTTNLTFSGASSTINITGSTYLGEIFQGGGVTFGTVVLASSQDGGLVMSGANTFSNLTITGYAGKKQSWAFVSSQTVTGTLTINGNSVTNRLLIQANTIGTSITLSAATVTVTNADFMDIAGAGAGSWNLSAITGGSGDCGGNSGITFTTGANQYYKIGASDNWSTTANWYLATNGGGGAGRVPLPQDTAIFDANSITAGSVVITQDMPRIGGVNWTGVTNTPTWTTSTECSVFGSITLVSGMTLTASTPSYAFQGRGSYTLTNAGKSWAKTAIYINAPGGTLTLQDEFTLTGTGRLVLLRGTFNANNFNLSMPGFTSTSGDGASTRTLTMGSGTWTLTRAASNYPWNINSSSLTFNANTSTIKIATASASNSNFNGGGLTYNNLWYAPGANTGSLTVAGSNTFNDFKDDGSVAHSIKFTAGTTTTVTTFTVSGTAGQKKTIDSTTTSTHTLVKAGGGTISCDYLNIQHSVATPSNTWYAGNNSTNNQAVATAGSGWNFTIPTGQGGFFSIF